jgi:hypothetical protein
MKAVFERVDLPAVPLERAGSVQAYLRRTHSFGPRLSVTFQIDAAARQVMKAAVPAPADRRERGEARHRAVRATATSTSKRM